MRKIAYVIRKDDFETGDRILDRFPILCHEDQVDIKAIHAQEDRAAARQKAEQVASKLRENRLWKDCCGKCGEERKPSGRFLMESLRKCWPRRACVMWPARSGDTPVPGYESLGKRHEPARENFRLPRRGSRTSPPDRCLSECAKNFTKGCTDFESHSSR